MKNFLRLPFIILALCCAMAAQQISVPQQATAGESVTLTTSGSGNATLYLVGPGTSIKRSVKLGESVPFSGDDLVYAGRYTAIIDGQAQSFYVAPGKPLKLNFMARPSRVPVAQPNVISGAVMVLDRNDNLVTTPQSVKFELGVNGAAPISQSVPAKDGIAFIRAASGKREGPAQFTASIGDISVRRIVQQVASDPCNLRIKAQRNGDNIVVETEPVRDCSGNPVPDGTIVTFIESGGRNGKSTVDARVKHGVAKATLPAVPGATLSVASGVVLGNEIHFGGQQ
jgi:hypothetical protein